MSRSAAGCPSPGLACPERGLAEGLHSAIGEEHNRHQVLRFVTFATDVCLSSSSSSFRASAFSATDISEVSWKEDLSDDNKRHHGEIKVTTRRRRGAQLSFMAIIQVVY